MNNDTGNDHSPANDDDTLDYGYLAHQVAQTHLDACHEAQCELEDGAQFDDVNDPSFGPFCGCSTCVVREVLFAAWPVMEEYFRREFKAGRL